MKKIKQGQTRWMVCKYVESGVEGVGAFPCYVTNVVQGCIVYRLEGQGYYSCNAADFRKLHGTFRKAMAEVRRKS